jgi:hypothetical protein
VKEGLTLIGVVLERTTLTCSKRNCDARKKNPTHDWCMCPENTHRR